MGVKGPKSKSKIEEQRFVECHNGEMTAKKWTDSIEKQKKRINLKETTTTTNNRLLAWAWRSTATAADIHNVSGSGLVMESF